MNDVMTLSDTPVLALDAEESQLISKRDALKARLADGDNTVVNEILTIGLMLDSLPAKRAKAQAEADARARAKLEATTRAQQAEAESLMVASVAAREAEAAALATYLQAAKHRKAIEAEIATKTSVTVSYETQIENAMIDMLDGLQEYRKDIAQKPIKVVLPDDLKIDAGVIARTFERFATPIFDVYNRLVGESPYVPAPDYEPDLIALIETRIEEKRAQKRYDAVRVPYLKLRALTANCPTIIYAPSDIRSTQQYRNLLAAGLPPRVLDRAYEVVNAST